MDASEELQLAKLALQACQQQRDYANNQVIDLRVDLTLAQARIATLEAAAKESAPADVKH